MKTRHRVPSIFNLSMVDVLCCALGCVILLWLLNLREAKQKAIQAGRANEHVAALEADLKTAREQLEDLGRKYAMAQDYLSDAERQATATRSRLEAAEAEGRDLAGRLRRSQDEQAAA